MAIAIARPAIVEKADWQRDELQEGIDDFLAKLEDDNRRFLQAALAVAGERAPRVSLPLSTDGLAAFEGLADVLTEGWNRGHETVLRYARRRVRKAIQPVPELVYELELVAPPGEFVQRYRRRELRLAGVYNSARLDWVQGVIARGSREGWGVRETRKELETRFPAWNRQRLENIARTESSLVYTHGEYARMTGSPFVIGYEFSAVMDERTSAICEARHGRHYRKGEHVDVPPLHYQCRSELLPIFEDESLRIRPLPPDAPAPLEGFGAPPKLPQRLAA